MAEITRERPPDDSSDLRMDAYYFGFDPTGVRPIDEILSAVATAGKAYHHTEMWGDAYQPDEPTQATLIQAAAVRAADRIAELERELEAARELIDVGIPHVRVGPNHKFWLVKRAYDAARAAQEGKS